jgi:hypothetical protein
MRKLPFKGLDSKGEIIDKYLTTVTFAQIFGNVHKFKITNPLLIEEQKKNCKTFTGRFIALATL